LNFTFVFHEFYVTSAQNGRTVSKTAYCVYYKCFYKMDTL